MKTLIVEFQFLNGTIITRYVPGDRLFNERFNSSMVRLLLTTMTKTNFKVKFQFLNGTIITYHNDKDKL